MFFGRDELLDQIRRQIEQSGNVVLLEEVIVEPGKSSILRHLEGLSPVPGWLGVYCSLQGAEESGKSRRTNGSRISRNCASITKGYGDVGVNYHYRMCDVS